MDLDARIAALREAVESKDGNAIATHLEAIDAVLQAASPLVRATTYAHVQRQLGRPADAAKVLEDLLAVMGDHAATYYQLGCYRSEAGDIDDALAAFARAGELDPMMVDAWVNRGTLLDARGLAEDAVASYRNGVLADPTDIGVWRNLGNSLAALERFAEAIASYDTALGLAPDDLALTILRASAFQAQGDIERANASVPEGLRASVGSVVEVRHTTDVDLRCRFHVQEPQRARWQQAASALLGRAADALTPTALPQAWGEGYLVRRDQTILLCDADQTRAGVPTRFFDATRLVAQHA